MLQLSSQTHDSSKQIRSEDSSLLECLVMSDVEGVTARMPKVLKVFHSQDATRCAVCCSRYSPATIQRMGALGLALATTATCCPPSALYRSWHCLISCTEWMWRKWQRVGQIVIRTQLQLQQQLCCSTPAPTAASLLTGQYEYGNAIGVFAVTASTEPAHGRGLEWVASTATAADCRDSM